MVGGAVKKLKTDAEDSSLMAFIVHFFKIIIIYQCKVPPRDK